MRFFLALILLAWAVPAGAQTTLAERLGYDADDKQRIRVGGVNTYFPCSKEFHPVTLAAKEAE